MSDSEALLRKIQALPPESAAEVEDFIEFISARARRRAAMDRLLALAPALESVGAPPLTDAEIEAEIDAARAARRARGLGAGCS